MITPEEIKKGLELCAADDCYEEKHNGCPYDDDELCIRHLCGDALAYINQLESRVPKWISVKDRLPEDQRSVLTVNGHGEIRTMGLWSKFGDEWTWVHNFCTMHYNDITHWMPMPEPPKEE